MDRAIEHRNVPQDRDESIDLSAGFVPKQDSQESPEPTQPAPGDGRAHVDDIVEPEGEETAPRHAPQDGWTVIAEEDVVQPHPHLAAETVLLVSVMADGSLLDLLSSLVADCFCSVSHQAIFTAMLTLQSQGVPISVSTLESQCAATGTSDSLPVLTRMSSLVPVLAVDLATFYRYIGIVKYQWLTRKLRWCLQMVKDESTRGASPVWLISELQQALAALKTGYDAINRPSPHEQQETNYNDAKVVAASRCTLGNFDC